MVNPIWNRFPSRGNCFSELIIGETMGVTETLFVKSRLTFYDNSMDRIILRLTKH